MGLIDWRFHYVSRHQTTNQMDDVGYSFPNMLESILHLVICGTLPNNVDANHELFYHVQYQDWQAFQRGERMLRVLIVAWFCNKPHLPSRNLVCSLPVKQELL